MRTRIDNIAEHLRTSFWFLPVLMTLGAAVLAYVTLNLDDEFSGTWHGLLYNGGPDGARVLLSTLAASMVTVAATVFSVTIVAMTLASSQFGPRVLTNFVRDRGNQLTIGVLLAAFLYAVLVLRQVRSGEGGVPNISVSLALAFGVVAVLVLIYFIHHIAISIQVMTLTQAIWRDLDARVDDLFPDAVEFPDTRPAEVTTFWTRGPGQRVTAGSSGYVQSIDVARLMSHATAHDLRLRVELRPGKFAVSSTTLATVWGPGGETVDDDVLASMANAFELGSRRKHGQDVEFPMAQLTEVAVRALSPAINDPFTASACVNHLSAALCGLAAREMPPQALADDDGTTRVRLGDPITFDSLVRVAYDQIRQAAAGHVTVYLKLLDALTEVVGCVEDPSRLDDLAVQADLVRERAGQAVPQEVDRHDVEVRYARFLGAVEQVRASV